MATFCDIQFETKQSLRLTFVEIKKSQNVSFIVYYYHNIHIRYLFSKQAYGKMINFTKIQLT